MATTRTLTFEVVFCPDCGTMDKLLPSDKPPSFYCKSDECKGRDRIVSRARFELDGWEPTCLRHYSGQRVIQATVTSQEWEPFSC